MVQDLKKCNFISYSPICLTKINISWKDFRMEHCPNECTIFHFLTHIYVYISQKRIRRAYSEFATLFKIYIYIFFNVCTIIRENDIRIFFKGIHWEMINTLVKLPVFHSEQKKKNWQKWWNFFTKISVRKKVNWVS